MASLIYSHCLLDAMRGLMNFESDNFSVMLVSGDYVPDRFHTKRSEVYPEASGKGYSQQRTSVALDMLNDGAINISLGGVRWKNASVTARYAVYFRDFGGDAADDDLVACIDFGENVTSTHAPFALGDSLLQVVS